TTANSTVPATAWNSASQTSAPSTWPTQGRSIRWVDRPHRIGRNTISVMNEETTLRPMPSIIEEKFCVSSWLRRAFYGANLRPVGHVVEGHRPAPAEQVVRVEEGVEHQHEDVDRDNDGDGRNLPQILVEGDRSLLARIEGGLDEVV